VWVDQFAEGIDLFVAAELDRADLDDVVGPRIRPRGFEVERDEYVVSYPCQLSPYIEEWW